MYKIYINNTPLFLLESGEVPSNLPMPDKEHLVARHTGKAKGLLNYADMLEKSDRMAYVALHSTDYEGLVADFMGHYTLIEAAGGVVVNPAGEVLFIFRLGTWDLPKGKIDPGEDPPTAALREVQEETGLEALTLGLFLCHTYHTYRNGKGKRVLKRTHWYRMSCPTAAVLVPQAEEGIELAVWRRPVEVLEDGGPIYGSIRDVLALA